VLDYMDWNGVSLCGVSSYVLYTVPSPFGICVYLLLKVRNCVTYEGTKLHIIQHA
jgi:hypothetical protein